MLGQIQETNNLSNKLTTLLSAMHHKAVSSHTNLLYRTKSLFVYWVYTLSAEWLNHYKRNAYAIASVEVVVQNQVLVKWFQYIHSRSLKQTFFEWIQ